MNMYLESSMAPNSKVFFAIKASLHPPEAMWDSSTGYLTEHSESEDAKTRTQTSSSSPEKVGSFSSA